MKWLNQKVDFKDERERWYKYIIIVDENQNEESYSFSTSKTMRKIRQKYLLKAAPCLFSTVTLSSFPRLILWFLRINMINQVIIILNEQNRN